MSKANRIESGKRFAADLRRIREEQGISIEEFHEETKIAVALIESFEESGLFKHPMFNRVYLRSFVRTYADLVDVETQEALKYLELAMEGEYRGELFQDDTSREAVPPAEKPVEEQGPGGERESLQEEPSDGDGEDVAAVPSGASSRKEPSQARTSATGSDTGDKETAEGDQGPEESQLEGRAAPEDIPISQEDEVDDDWSSASPSATGTTAAAKTPESPPERAGSKSSLSGKWRSSKADSTSMPVNVIAGAAVIVILGAVVFFIFRAGDSPDQAPNGEADMTAVDTVEDEEEELEERPPADITLGDLMNFTVVAEEGAVQGIRITRDSDLRRPYWIEEGEATVFPARQRIVIEEQLENIRLLLEGFTYPTDQPDDQGRVVVDRDAAQAFADTVRGEPYSLTVQPDTNRVPSP